MLGVLLSSSPSSSPSSAYRVGTTSSVRGGAYGGGSDGAFFSSELSRGARARVETFSRRSCARAFFSTRGSRLSLGCTRARVCFGRAAPCASFFYAGVSPNVFSPRINFCVPFGRGQRRKEEYEEEKEENEEEEEEEEEDEEEEEILAQNSD